MSTQEVVTASVILVGPVLSLAALWLRLRFQTRGESERRRYLLSAAAALPAGSRIQEHHSDGTSLALIVGTTQQKEQQ